MAAGMDSAGDRERVSAANHCDGNPVATAPTLSSAASRPRKPQPAYGMTGPVEAQRLLSSRARAFQHDISLGPTDDKMPGHPIMEPF